MKIAWVTDIHLNFLKKDKREEFYQKIVDTGCEIILISGDIAEGDNVIFFLEEMYRFTHKVIGFVLGNHDFYQSSIKEIKVQLHLAHLPIKFIPESNWIIGTQIGLFDKSNFIFTSQETIKKTLITGTNGWADGRYGDYENSQVRMNDHFFIRDFIGLNKQEILKKMQELADKDAKLLQNKLEILINENIKNVIIITHVPPYKESSTYLGKPSGKDFLPFYSSKATGDVITEFAEKHRSIDFLVLCGHTHNRAEFRKFDNLLVKTGGASYYDPEIQEVFEI